MRLEVGMRVRCVDDSDLFGSLQKGQEYSVSRSISDHVIGDLFELNELPAHWFVQSRFKPIVRVKALGVGTPPQWRRDMHIFATAGW